MSALRRAILRDEAASENWEHEAVEFRLTYHGPLLAETNRDGTVRRARAEHKQQIRKALHPQLKRLWQVSPVLTQDLPPLNQVYFARLGREHTIEEIANRFAIYNYNFVPLVTRKLELLCSVEVLLLRYGEPGGIISKSGDVDNRLKTLFDALCMPRSAGQLGSYVKPDDAEVPFYCLLEDDSLITKASVEVDTLLQPLGGQPDPNDARVVITVRVRPAQFSAANAGFLS